jgi:hypothetical protein
VVKKLFLKKKKKKRNWLEQREKSLFGRFRTHSISINNYFRTINHSFLARLTVTQSTFCSKSTILSMHSVLALCKNWPKIGICDFSNLMMKFIKVSWKLILFYDFNLGLTQKLPDVFWQPVKVEVVLENLKSTKWKCSH